MLLLLPRKAHTHMQADCYVHATPNTHPPEARFPRFPNNTGAAQPGQSGWQASRQAGTHGRVEEAPKGGSCR